MSGMWDDLVGQSAAIETMRQAATAAHDRTSAPGAMTHSWLITGPPGSGRSNLAYAFAAALLGDGPDSDPATIRQVVARTHPDLAVLSTEKVIISIDEVRTLVTSSQYSPSVSNYRVMVIEDADRMTERTSNLLLKALEEPPPRTVWILCAPSDADLLPTIRSRVRTVRLRIPEAEDVADLLVARDGVERGVALAAAREAQSHIGMARRLAKNPDARERRAETLRLALGLRSVPSAVEAAARLVELAKADAESTSAERDAAEREQLLRTLGIEPGGTIPPALRSQVKALEDDQKRRSTRSLRDGIDRILLDYLSLYRDILLRQLGAEVPLMNSSVSTELEAAALAGTAAHTLEVMDAVAAARRRIEANVPPALALEAMLVSAARKGAA
ncbi:DNA polymerase III subunit delta' [Herbiconiux sp. L3-i23]|uniref:DNA polymerase III subunit delta' n=1 Tax=Herbiconiux sp. L3-i23 TaxID=2905871 RepID=UPI00204C03D4|nr:DNA polymerase III subunit delta' [Herbiconiux sp. L3-i23]BDI21533.1 DNA polymerase III subunit delta' [Herbiconiux sp. L3-i23]